MSEAATDEMELGPIDYLVVEYPGGRMTGEALPHLIELVESGTIRILDVALLRKSAGDDTFDTIRPADLVVAGAPEFAVLEGAASGLMDAEDLREVAGILDAGSAAVVLVYENTWAGPFATAMRRAGGQLIANGRIPVQALLAAIEDDAAGAVESV